MSKFNNLFHLMIIDSLLVAFSSGVLIIIGAVAQFFLARWLTIEQYGEWSLLTSWLVLAGFFSLNSFSNIVYKASAQKYSYFFKTANKICFSTSLIGSLFLLIVGLGWQSEFWRLYILMAISLPFYSGINLSGSYYLGSAQFKKYSIFTIVSQLIITFFQIVVVFISKDVTNLVLSSIISTAVINLVITGYIYWRVEGQRNNQMEEELTRYGFSLTFISLIGTVAAKIQYIILASLSTPSAVAIYAVAQMLPDKIKNLLKSLLNPFSTYLASISRDRTIKIIRQSIKFFSLIGIIFALLGVLSLPLLIKIIFSTKYVGSIFYSQILLFPAVLVPFEGLIGSLMVYHDYKKFNYQLTTYGGLLRILLYLIFIPLFQVEGIIVAFLLSSLIIFIYEVKWFYGLEFHDDQRSILVLAGQEENIDDTLCQRFNIIFVNSKLTGDNIIKIFAADYFYGRSIFPRWMRILVRMCGIKMATEAVISPL